MKISRDPPRRGFQTDSQDAAIVFFHFLTSLISFFSHRYGAPSLRSREAPASAARCIIFRSRRREDFAASISLSIHSFETSFGDPKWPDAYVSFSSPSDRKFPLTRSPVSRSAFYPSASWLPEAKLGFVL